MHEDDSSGSSVWTGQGETRLRDLGTGKMAPGRDKVKDRVRLGCKMETERQTRNSSEKLG